jgi:hypothetical protein
MRIVCLFVLKTLLETKNIRLSAYNTTLPSLTTPHNLLSICYSKDIHIGTSLMLMNFVHLLITRTY